ncbi:MAG: transglutaminase domain-containing protein [Myxococcaceae bacterium]|nr:transglutaminase domain-containing protein [Myxococcaceae bacterium]
MGSSAGAAERAQFLFSLSGVPVGVVTLEADEARGLYRYTSTQTFTRGAAVSKRTRSESFPLRADATVGPSGRVLESLWLWRGPWRPGCVDAESELDHRVARLCVTSVTRERIEGTINDERFFGRVAGARLVAVDLGQARFERVAEVAHLPPPVDLFGSGWPIAGPEQGELFASDGHRRRVPEPSTPPLRAWPDVKTAQALASKVHRALEPTGQTCLEFARRFVADAKSAGQEAVIVHGLWADPGASRALPHAWVRLRTGAEVVDLDPTLMIPVRATTHLPLAIAGHGDPGRAWLALLSGAWQIRRSP